MKVVVLGGYGVVGSLLAKLLARDGHQLWLAGRNPSKAKALAQEIGAQVLQVDPRNSPEGLFAAKPDVIIDAAGPFQFYGDYPYKIAACALKMVLIIWICQMQVTLPRVSRNSMKPPNPRAFLSCQARRVFQACHLALHPS